MTHFVALVIGDNIEGQLARYDENIEVDRYATVVNLDQANWLTKYLVEGGVDLSDPVAVVSYLRAKWDDGSADAYAVDPEGRLIEWSTYSPDSRAGTGGSSAVAGPSRLRSRTARRPTPLRLTRSTGLPRSPTSVGRPA